jgi:tellurite resistance protein
LSGTSNKRQEATIARRNQQTAAMQTERELREDYKEARELIRVAIDEADLDDEDELKKLIGL